MNIQNIFIKAQLVIFIAFLLAGCITQGQATGLKNKQEQWSVVLVISGGFAGWMRNISVDTRGALIINDLKRNKSIRKQLNNSELASLSNLVTKQKSIYQTDVVTELSQKCKDCFHYKLSIRWHNRQQLVSLNDLNLPKSSYNKIINFLKEMTIKYYR